METGPQKNISQISYQELFKDLFEAVTDLEKKWFKTSRDLLLVPEKVIHSYLNEGKTQYFSVFRFFLMSLFLSFMAYLFFYQPVKIGGPLHNDLLEGFKQGVGLKGAEAKNNYVIDIEKYNFFFTQFSELFTRVTKLLSALIIPSLLVGIFLFFRKRQFNFASLLVISLFLGAQASLIGAVTLTLIGLAMSGMFEGSVEISLFVLFVESLYFLYALYRINRHEISKPFFRSVGATLFLTSFYSLMSMVAAIFVYLYVGSTTPSFLVKTYSVPEGKSPGQESPFYPSEEKLAQ